MPRPSNLFLFIYFLGKIFDWSGITKFWGCSGAPTPPTIYKAENLIDSLFFKEKKSKGLGEGCDPRARMNQCNDGLHCYQKSDNLGDGMCVPKWKNGGYVNYRKIGKSEDFKCGLFNYHCFLILSA